MSKNGSYEMAKDFVKNPEKLMKWYSDKYQKTIPEDLRDLCERVNNLIIRAYENGFKDSANAV